MQNITVRDRQNLLDIAVQETGAAEGAMQLAAANGLSLTGELANGQALAAATNLRSEVVSVFRREKRKPATGGNTILSGIDYWIVEGDFVVQGG